MAEIGVKEIVNFLYELQKNIYFKCNSIKALHYGRYILQDKQNMNKLRDPIQNLINLNTVRGVYEKTPGFSIAKLDLPFSISMVNPRKKY